MALREMTLKAFAQQVRPYLQQQAKEGKVVTYGDLGSLFALPRQSIGEIVGEVSAQEHASGRPLLSVIVVRKDTGLPGDGFWGDPGIPSQLALSQLLTPSVREARRVFAKQEQLKVFQYWKA